MPSNPRIIVEFLAETAGLTRGLQNVESQTGRTSSSFRRLGGIVAGAVSIGAIVQFGRASVTAATEDAEAQALLASALQNTTGATQAQIDASEQYIANLSRSAAIADDELRPALANLVRASGDVGQAQRDLALATDIAAGRGQSVESVSNALARAYAGNTTALKRMGVATEDAAGNALSLDQIMANAAETFDGQAAVAAGTTAGQMRNASIQFGEFQEELAGAVMPAVTAFAGILIDDVLPALQSLAGWISDNIDWLGPLALTLGTVAAAIWAVNAATAAWEAAQLALNVVMSANPIVLVVIAIAALVAGVVIAYQKVGWFRDAVDTAVDGIVAAWNFLWGIFKSIFNWIGDHWQLLLSILTGPIGIAVGIISSNFDTIKAAATAVWEWVRDKFQAIADFISGLVGSIASTARRIADALVAPLNAVIRAWNNLRVPSVTFNIPHVPGTDIGGDITIGGWELPNIPTLARGGVLTRPTFFVGGEAGTEIVAPEKLLRSIVAEAGGPSVVYNVTVEASPSADLAAIGRATVEAIMAYERTGGRAWRTAQVGTS